jgi:pimeloyl-ACP methyl ester carboxylesterase
VQHSAPRPPAIRYLCGGEFTARKNARFVADLGIADTDVHLLDEASHFLQEDRPDDLADLIAAFTTRAAGGATRDSRPA